MPTASEAQMHRLLEMHAAGASPLAIAAELGLSLKVVEAVVDSPLTQALRANAATASFPATTSTTAPVTTTGAPSCAAAAGSAAGSSSGGTDEPSAEAEDPQRG